MKLEFLDDIDNGGQFPYADPKELVRLYDFDASEIAQLQKAFRLLSQGKMERLEMAKLSYVIPLNCTLIFIVDEQGAGMEMPGDKKNFVCRFPQSYFKQMIEIINSVVNSNKEVSGYNWLYDPPVGKFDLLFSAGGSW